MTASGPTYGLQVLFDLETYETMGLFSPNSGLKLFLTEPGTTDQGLPRRCLERELNFFQFEEIFTSLKKKHKTVSCNLNQR